MRVEMKNESVLKGMSWFSLQNCFFQGSFSNAFDGDFVIDKVIDCVFRNIKGDVIDLSGSEAEIINCDLELIEDKGISVVGNSKVSVQNSRKNKVSLGIVEGAFLNNC